MGKSLKIILPKTAFVNRKGKSMKTELHQSKIKLAVLSAIVAGSMGLSATSYAATQTGTMTVSTSVAVSCTVGVTQDISFAGYDTTATDDLDATGILRSTCTNGGAAKITLGQGAGGHESSTATNPVRQMKNGAGKLRYNLFTDNGHSAVWGDTADTGKAITGTGASITTNVYARITKNQAVIAGTYNDSIAVTLTY